MKEKLLERIKKKAKELKEAGNRKYLKARDWASDHKEEIKTGAITVGILAAPIAKQMLQSKIRIKNAKREIKEKCSYIYDRRTGRYYWLKRPMKPRESDEYDRRYLSGESSSVILREMGLLR